MHVRSSLGVGALLSGWCAVVLAGASAPPVASASEPAIRAQLTPRESTALASQLAGKIEKVHVREGERFEKGARLVSFDCTLHRAQLDKAAAMELEALKTHEVNQRLASLQSVSTLEVDVAAARLAGARAERAIVQVLVDRCSVVAPFPGRVAAVNVRSHQYVAEGEQLLEILDDRHLETEMIVPSRWLTWLRPGFVFQLAIDETGKTYPAEVTRIAARIDPVSQTLVVFGRVKVRSEDLLAGMSGRALFNRP